MLEKPFLCCPALSDVSKHLIITTSSSTNGCLFCQLSEFEPTSVYAHVFWRTFMTQLGAYKSNEVPSKNVV